MTGCSDSVVRVYDVHSGQCLKYSVRLYSCCKCYSISCTHTNVGYFMVILDQLITLHLMEPPKFVEEETGM